MANYTENLNLFKYDTVADSQVPFSINDALNDNWDKIDSSVVNKSGDTMTGGLAISEDATAEIKLTNTYFDATSTTAPASNLYAGAIDIFGSDNYHVGHFRTRHNTGNNFQSQMGVKRSINNTNYEANITVEINPAGTSSCTFPNTKCCDGQWVKNQQVILDSAHLYHASNTHVSKTVGLPNDGCVYEVLFKCYCNSGTTEGDRIAVQFNTNVSLGGQIYGGGARAVNSYAQYSYNEVIAPMKYGSGNLVIERSSSYSSNSKVTLVVLGYRRLGTNSY